MLRLTEVRLPVSHDETQLKQKLMKLLNIREEPQITIRRRSIDSRKKPELFYVYTIDVELDKKTEEKLLKKNLKNLGKPNDTVFEIPVTGAEKRVIVVGSGPAGLFAALVLSRAGLRPVVIERGRNVDERTRDVDAFWEKEKLDPESNVLFGEGGAGTFSDGKLESGIKDKHGYIRFILETFAYFGGGDTLLYDAKPHVGTDRLKTVVKGIRSEIEANGGEYRFGVKMTDIDVSNGHIRGIELSDGTYFEADEVILALGHSAADTFEMLHKRGLAMEPKAFAVGFRIEHPQSMIDEYSYGRENVGKLPASSYKLTYNGDRSVYSFCMCPGGYIVNSSDSFGRLVINGMSYSDRASGNANSAIIFSTSEDDFSNFGGDVFRGLKFQKYLEEKAYSLGNGRIIQQLYGDFISGKITFSYGTVKSAHKGKVIFADFHELLPRDMQNAFFPAMEHFGHIIPGFNREDAVLSAIESRTSSPVRILRSESYESNFKGLYPCGEGAGYAGGITSAAADGIRVAMKIVRDCL